jgi:hypothetical protein
VNIDRITRPIMTAVVQTGAVRQGDEETASRILQEELKAFLGLSDAAPKYEDERELVRENGPRGERLALQSIVTECVRRIINERAA